MFMYMHNMCGTSKNLANFTYLYTVNGQTTTSKVWTIDCTRVIICTTTCTTKLKRTYMSIPWMSVTPANIPFRLDLEPPQQVRRELSSCQRLRVWFISLRIPSSSCNKQQVSQNNVHTQLGSHYHQVVCHLAQQAVSRISLITRQAKSPPQSHPTLGVYIPLNL